MKPLIASENVILIAKALLDSNVIIAAVAEIHEHHAPSAALLAGQKVVRCSVAAHSYAKAYSTLTRRGDHAPFRFKPDEAWAALERIAALTDLIGLTPAQAFGSIRAFAQSGGIGARLYNRLVGEAAIANDLSAIITWNVRHMRSLFPVLEVVTPAELALSG
jgi:predicted nucleic acid-binding protein